MKINKQSLPICPCCNEEADYLVRHHWHEEDGSLQTKDICPRCNVLLGFDCPVSMGNGVYYPWPIQAEYIKDLNRFLDTLKFEYTVTLFSKEYEVKALDHENARRIAARLYKKETHDKRPQDVLRALSRAHKKKPE